MTQQQLEIAIHSALAALERPHYGDNETVLDNAADAKEILRAAVIQQQLEAPVSAEDFKSTIKNAWFDGFQDGYVSGYSGLDKDWEYSNTYKSLRTKNKVTP